MELSTPWRAWSSGTPMVDATTSALAPGYRVLTWMVGGTISGYWATGRPYRNTAPMMMVMRAMTLAKIGRSMKNLEITARPSSREAMDGRLARAGGWRLLARA